MPLFRNLCLSLGFLAFFPVESVAQPISQTVQTTDYSYADLADFVLQSPVMIDAQIRSATQIKEAKNSNVIPAKARFLITADVLALIRGTDGSPKQVQYLVEMPLDAKGRAPKLKKNRLLLFARTVSGKPGVIQLVAPDSQLSWSAALDSRARSILTEAIASDSPPTITGIGNSFYVPGAIPGEGETQIFLNTVNKMPVSLSILRRPGQAPNWSVALGEIVDEAAGTPKRDTMLWYRLACFLPTQLPESTIENANPAEADAARADYAVVLRGLGKCVRTRPANPQLSFVPR